MFPTIKKEQNKNVEIRTVLQKEIANISKRRSVARNYYLKQVFTDYCWLKTIFQKQMMQLLLSVVFVVSHQKQLEKLPFLTCDYYKQPHQQQLHMEQIRKQMNREKQKHLPRFQNCFFRKQPLTCSTFSLHLIQMVLAQRTQVWVHQTTQSIRLQLTDRKQLHRNPPNTPPLGPAPHSFGANTTIVNYLALLPGKNNFQTSNQK